MLPEHSFSLHSPDSKKTFQIAVLTPASDDFAANSTSGNLISQAFRNIAGASETLHLKKDDMLLEKEP